MKELFKWLAIPLILLIVSTSLLAERGGPGNQYILVKGATSGRWLSQRGKYPFDYTTNDTSQVQILTNGTAKVDLWENPPSANGSDSICIWTPEIHEVVIVYDLAKVGDNDPLGGFQVSSITNISAQVKNFRKLFANQIEQAGDDIRPVIYVSSPQGVNNPSDGWYILANSLAQTPSNTNWQTLVWSDVFLPGSPNNIWVERGQQKQTVLNTFPSRTQSFFRFERWWIARNANNETTTMYGITNGTISAVGIVILGGRGSINWKESSGKLKINDIRLY